MKKDDIYNVKIVDVDIKGNGIAKINNFVVFIKGVLLNDEVKIKITNVEKRFANGEVIDKANNLCPYYYKCGGCNYLHISCEEENLLKEKMIKKLFPSIKIQNIEYENKYNYRNKVIFHVVSGKIGYYFNNTHDLVEINNCLLLNHNINDILKEIKVLNLNNIDSILIKSTQNTNEIMIVFYGNIDNSEIDKINNDKIKSIYVNDTLIKGSSYIIDEINSLKFVIGPNSFFQVNPLCMIKLYEKIKFYAVSGNTLLDLYCGTGSIGLYLSNNFKEVVGIEVVKESISNALINKKINKIDNVSFINDDASSIKNKKFSCIIVDPPRSGLSKKVMDNLLEMKAQKLIYVSCNPITLKRDLDYLNKSYEVMEITPFNMFYRTNHVECVCNLNSKESR